MVSSHTPDTDAPKIDRTDWDRPDRWARGFPWSPEIPDKQRVEIAQQWLEFLGIEPTDEMINKLKPHVMLNHPLSPKGQVANHLILRGEKPSKGAIARLWPHWAKKMAERDQEQGQELLSDPTIPKRVCDFIVAYRQEHGVGPLWRDVTNELGLRSNESTAVVLEALKATGFITFTPQTRSLNVTTDNKL